MAPRGRKKKKQPNYTSPTQVVCDGDFLDVEIGMQFKNGLGFILEVMEVRLAEVNWWIKYKIDKTYEIEYFPITKFDRFRVMFKHITKKDPGYKSNVWQYIGKVD